MRGCMVGDDGARLVDDTNAKVTPSDDAKSATLSGFETSYASGTHGGTPRRGVVVEIA